MEGTFSGRRFARAIGALVVVLLGGTLAFRALLPGTWLEALYRTVLTVSLTGVDVEPRGTAPTVLTIALIASGLAIFGYVAGVIVDSIARGILTGVWAERRRRRTIERLRDHYIICGYGRVGRRIAAEFRDAGARYVVLDFSPAAIEAARERGDLLIDGNATEDDDLREAGLETAKGLVASADSDADNVYITLSARTARPDLLIVARASGEDAAKKLRLAGADRVVLPYSTAGREMAKLVLKPQVAAFLDVVSTTDGPDLSFEEIEVTRACGRAGRSIRELRIRDRTGAILVALRKRDGTFDTTPAPDAVLEEGDVMIGVGTAEEIRALEELFAPKQVTAR